VLTDNGGNVMATARATGIPETITVAPATITAHLNLPLVTVTITITPTTVTIVAAPFATKAGESRSRALHPESIDEAGRSKAARGACESYGRLSAATTSGCSGARSLRGESILRAYLNSGRGR
jgi:hypothetical protein